MEETFDIYTKRTVFYSFMQASTAAFATAIIGCFFHPQLNYFFQIVFPVLFFLTLPLAIAGMFIWKMPPEKLYIKDGEMILRDISISLPGKDLLWEELKHCEITAYNYKGKPGRVGNDGTNNKISILTKADQTYESKFVVNSIGQRKNLEKIMKHWKYNGFKIISNGIDLI